MKKIIGVLASLGCITVAVTALAGAKQDLPVSIGLLNGEYTVAGTMGSTRATSDSLSMIGCMVQAYSTDTSPDVICYGRDSTGLLIQCTSNAAAFVTAATAITSDSYIHWSAPNVGLAICDSLWVGTNSRFLPKTP